MGMQKSHSLTEVVMTLCHKAMMYDGDGLARFLEGSPWPWTRLHSRSRLTNHNEESWKKKKAWRSWLVLIRLPCILHHLSHKVILDYIRVTFKKGGGRLYCTCHKLNQRLLLCIFVPSYRHIMPAGCILNYHVHLLAFLCQSYRHIIPTGNSQSTSHIYFTPAFWKSNLRDPKY